jgi:hypothetical protein
MPIQAQSTKKLVLHPNIQKAVNKYRTELKNASMG